MKWFAALLLLSSSAFSASLPNGLSTEDIDKIVSEVGTSGATRLLRSAEAYPKFWPGIKVGIEFDMLFAGGLAELGNRNGNIPGFIPQPKLYLSKGLFFGFEIIFSFFPSSIMSTIGSTGGILKWTFYDESKEKFAVAFFGGYSSISGLNGTYEGSTWEGGAYASKDYVRLRPYLGAALMLMSGSVPLGYAASGNGNGSGFAFHTFLGCEFNLPVAISLQLDIYNLTPRASLLFAKKW